MRTYLQERVESERQRWLGFLQNVLIVKKA